jgi:hypothetical protein
MTSERTISTAMLAMACAVIACDAKLSGEPESLNAGDITVNRSGASDTEDAGLRQGDTTNSLNAGPGATGGTGAVSATAGASTAGSNANSGTGGALAPGGSGGGGVGGTTAGGGGARSQGRMKEPAPPADSAMGAGPSSGAVERTR